MANASRASRASSTTRSATAPTATQNSGTRNALAPLLVVWFGIDMASIDGASGWKMLRHIILPALKPFILVALVFRTIDALRVFALAWAITKGGPSRASEVSQLYIFNLGIGQYFNLGYASAAATLFALFVGLISGGYLLMMRRADR